MITEEVNSFQIQNREAYLVNPCKDSITVLTLKSPAEMSTIHSNK